MSQELENLVDEVVDRTPIEVSKMSRKAIFDLFLTTPEKRQAVSSEIYGRLGCRLSLATDDQVKQATKELLSKGELSDEPGI